MLLSKNVSPQMYQLASSHFLYLQLRESENPISMRNGSHLEIIISLFQKSGKISQIIYSMSRKFVLPVFKQRVRAASMRDSSVRPSEHEIRPSEHEIQNASPLSYFELETSFQLQNVQEKSLMSNPICIFDRPLTWLPVPKHPLPVWPYLLCGGVAWSEEDNRAVENSSKVQ